MCHQDFNSHMIVEQNAILIIRMALQTMKKDIQVGEYFLQGDL